MTTRQIHFFDMHISARGKLSKRDDPIDFLAAPKDFSEIAEDVDQMFRNGDNLLQSGYTDKSASHYLKDFRIDDDNIIFLVNRCDPNGPDMATSNPVEKEHMVHSKPLGHGVDYSAHVVVKRVPVRGREYYLCVIETLVGSGLNATVIKSYLKHVVRKCRAEFPKKYQIPDISDPKIKVRHVHDVEFQGHPSDSFINDIENGHLSGIQAIRYRGKEGVLDTVGGISEQYRSIKFKVDTAFVSDVADSLKTLRNTILREYKEYSELRVGFRTADDQNKTAKISMDTGNLVDAEHYTKKFELKSIAVNQTSYTDISDAIIKEIMSYMGG